MIRSRFHGYALRSALSAPGIGTPRFDDDATRESRCGTLSVSRRAGGHQLARQTDHGNPVSGSLQTRVPRPPSHSSDVAKHRRPDPSDRDCISSRVPACISRLRRYAKITALREDPTPGRLAKRSPHVTTNPSRACKKLRADLAPAQFHLQAAPLYSREAQVVGATDVSHRSLGRRT